MILFSPALFCGLKPRNPECRKAYNKRQLFVYVMYYLCTLFAINNKISSSLWLYSLLNSVKRVHWTSDCKKCLHNTVPYCHPQACVVFLACFIGDIALPLQLLCSLKSIRVWIPCIILDTNSTSLDDQRSHMFQLDAINPLGWRIVGYVFLQIRGRVGVLHHNCCVPGVELCKGCWCLLELKDELSI